MSVNFVNLTSHAIVLQTNRDSELVIPPSGQVARVEARPGDRIGDLDGVACYGPSLYGQVTGLPDRVEGTVYIVSGMVAEQVRRGDVYSPGTGPNDGAIRNDKGHIVAVTRLIRSVGLLPG